MNLSQRFFSPEYFTARQRFRERAAAAGGRPTEIPLDAKGPNREELSIDVAWFGAAQPQRVLVHSSGLHGVEGFAGSAIQLQLIANVPALPPDGALILVHVLNPYGMAWLCRTNENNVDLNRNFLGDEPFSGAPPAYARLDSFLNPQTPPSHDFYALQAGWFALRYGMPALKAAVLCGQYEYPKGLFFGGRNQQQSGEKYQAFLASRLASVRRLITIDVHTGIGEYGKNILMVQQKDYDKVRAMFGNRVVPPNAQRSAGYTVRGPIEWMYPKVAPNSVIFSVTQEFGTYSPIRVLHALREENRWRHFGSGAPDHPTKHILKERFCPHDEEWRAAVLDRGRELLEDALSKL